MPYGKTGQEIKVELQRNGQSGIHAEIGLPENVGGEFIWKGEKVRLHSGEQEINL